MQKKSLYVSVNLDLIPDETENTSGGRSPARVTWRGLGKASEKMGGVN